MGQLLEGKRLKEVITSLEAEVKLTLDNETMNFLAMLNFIVDKNKQFSFGNPREKFICDKTKTKTL